MAYQYCIDGVTATATVRRGSTFPGITDNNGSINLKQLQVMFNSKKLTLMFTCILLYVLKHFEILLICAVTDGHMHEINTHKM